MRLRADRISVHFDGNRVLDEVSLEIGVGEFVLMKGPNGSGKTTLLNVLSGWVSPDSGSIKVFSDNGRNILCRMFGRGRPGWRNRYGPERASEAGCSRSWQDRRLFDSLTVEENLSVAKGGKHERLLSIFSSKILAVEQNNRATSQRLLRALGIESLANRRASEVSLGEGMKVGVARALNSGAGILLLDEPLAGLDSTASDGILTMLEGLCRERAASVIIVEHFSNFEKLKRRLSGVWSLDRGRISVEGPDVGLAAEVDPDESLLTLSSTWLSRGFALVGEKRLTGDATLRIFRSVATRESPPSLELDRFEVALGNDRLPRSGGHGISFLLRQGDVGILTAPNGWGKTSLLEGLAGRIVRTSGRVLLSGEPIGRSMAPWERRMKGLLYLPSRGFLFPRLSVGDHLSLAGAVDPDMFYLPERRRRAASLSGGEGRRLGLASTLLRERGKVIVLDEPSIGLDREGVQGLAKAIHAVVDDHAVLIAEPSRTPS